MMITVFTPTYNRAKLLHRVFESLQRQTYKEFCWLIIDDGSKDDTASVVNEMRKSANFQIDFIGNPTNQGKVALINQALDIVRGDFFLVFDSDDWCTPNALDAFVNAFDAANHANDYCAVSALKVYQTGAVVGEDYSRIRSLGESYISRFRRQIKGDKWEFIKTDIHRDHKYELAEGERYQAPEYAWLKMGQRYKTVFLNEALSIVEYQDDGISRNNIKYRVRSPLSTCKFYLLAFQSACSGKQKLRCAVNWFRFALNFPQIKSFSAASAVFGLYSFLSIPGGVVLFLTDKLKVKYF